MAEDLDSILRRVATGELTPEEAEPLVASVTGQASQAGDTTPPPSSRPPAPPSTPPAVSGPVVTSGAQRTVRLQVMENGRAVVNLRIPMSWASLAGSVLPGLSRSQADRIREAIRSGEVGPILDVRDEDGDGVIISTE